MWVAYYSAQYDRLGCTILGCGWCDCWLGQDDTPVVVTCVTKYLCKYSRSEWRYLYVDLSPSLTLRGFQLLSRMSIHPRSKASRQGKHPFPSSTWGVKILVKQGMGLGLLRPSWELKSAHVWGYWGYFTLGRDLIEVQWYSRQCSSPCIRLEIPAGFLCPQCVSCLGTWEQWQQQQQML